MTADHPETPSDDGDPPTDTHTRSADGSQFATETGLKVFASTLAHDLRTPLLVARGHLELMDGDPERTAAIEDALDTIERITDEVHTLAEKGGSLGPLVRIPLAVVAHRAWEQVPTGSATLHIADNRIVAADPVGLERILVNLFANAVEHAVADPEFPVAGDDAVEPAPELSGSPGRVVAVALSDTEPESHDGLTVTVGTLPDGFYVEDDGDGFPGDLDGSPSDPGATRRVEGDGMGLQLVEWFANAQGWSVEATTGRDGGARFEFTGVAPGADVDR